MKPRGDGGAADGRMPAQLGSCAGIALCRWVVRGRAGGGRPRTGADHARCKGCGARTRQPLRAATPAPSPPRRRRPPAAPDTGSHSTHHNQHPRPPGATRRLRGQSARTPRPTGSHSARPPRAVPPLSERRGQSPSALRVALRTALRGPPHRTPRAVVPHSAGSRAAGAARVGATAPRWRRAAQTHPRPAPTRRTLATPDRVDPHRHGAPRNAGPRKPGPRRPQGPARIPSPP